MDIEKLKQLIDEAGMNPHSFAVVAGIKPLTMYRILEGKQEPRMETLKKMTATLADKTKRSRVNVLGAITGIEDYSWN